MSTLAAFTLTLSATASAHQTPLEINSLCEMLMTPSQEVVRGEIDALRGWFNADIEVKAVNFLPAAQNTPRERETVLRVAITRHTPIRGPHKSGQGLPTSRLLPQEIEIHLDRWDWSEAELPIAGMRLEDAPIQIMDWRDRRYFRLDRTFVDQQIAKLLMPIAWDRWDRDSRLLFVQSKMGKRKPLPPGYRVYAGSLLISPVAGVYDVTLSAANHAVDLIQARFAEFQFDYLAEHVQWLTDATGRLLAIELKLHPDFVFYYDSSGQPL